MVSGDLVGVFVAQFVQRNARGATTQRLRQRIGRIQITRRYAAQMLSAADTRSRTGDAGQRVVGACAIAHAFALAHGHMQIGLAGGAFDGGACWSSRDRYSRFSPTQARLGNTRANQRACSARRSASMLGGVRMARHLVPAQVPGALGGWVRSSKLFYSLLGARWASG